MGVWHRCGFLLRSGTINQKEMAIIGCGACMLADYRGSLTPVSQVDLLERRSTPFLGADLLVINRSESYTNMSFGEDSAESAKEIS